MFTLKPESCLISSANFFASPFFTADNMITHKTENRKQEGKEKSKGGKKGKKGKRNLSMKEGPKRERNKSRSKSRSRSICKPLQLEYATPTFQPEKLNDFTNSSNNDLPFQRVETLPEKEKKTTWSKHNFDFGSIFHGVLAGGRAGRGHRDYS